LKRDDHVALQGLHLGRCFRRGFSQGVEGGLEERGRLGVGAEADARQTLRENEQALVRHANDLVNERQRADLIEVFRARSVGARIALGGNGDDLLFAERLDQLNRTLPANRQGQHGVGKQHSVTQRKNGSFLWHYQTSDVSSHIPSSPRPQISGGEIQATQSFGHVSHFLDAPNGRRVSGEEGFSAPLDVGNPTGTAGAAVPTGNDIKMCCSRWRYMQG
jgi:hypothetical protein